jgi:hypothetical protein
MMKTSISPKQLGEMTQPQYNSGQKKGTKGVDRGRPVGYEKRSRGMKAKIH